MYFSKGSLTQYRKYCESKSKGEPCCEFANKSQTAVLWCNPGHIYKILNITKFLHFRLPCALHTRGGTRVHFSVAQQYLLCAQCLISDAYVVETLCRSGQVSCWQGSRCAMSRPSWSDIVNTRLRWISLSLICFFFYLLSVCFLSAWG